MGAGGGGGGGGGGAGGIDLPPLDNPLGEAASVSGGLGRDTAAAGGF